jgi:hypothetical protein
MAWEPALTSRTGNPQTPQPHPCPGSDGTFRELITELDGATREPAAWRGLRATLTARQYVAADETINSRT